MSTTTKLWRLDYDLYDNGEAAEARMNCMHIARPRINSSTEFLLKLENRLNTHTHTESVLCALAHRGMAFNLVLERKTRNKSSIHSMDPFNLVQELLTTTIDLFLSLSTYR